MLLHIKIFFAGKWQDVRTHGVWRWH